jgi:hypothetical protein
VARLARLEAARATRDAVHVIRIPRCLQGSARIAFQAAAMADIPKRALVVRVPWRGPEGVHAIQP